MNKSHDLNKKALFSSIKRIAINFSFNNFEIYTDTIDTTKNFIRIVQFINNKKKKIMHLREK